MCSKGKTILHLVVTSCTVAILIVVGFGDISFAEAKNEVRSVPSLSTAQTRPTYQKPKPKLVLPKQLQQQKHDDDDRGGAKTDSATAQSNPNLVTQTVYGFLDFVTTVGNTVMIFTPQTKKVDSVSPSSSTATPIRETVLLQPTQTVTSFVVSEVIETPKDSNQRSARLLEISEEENEPIGAQLEASEVEPQIFTPTSAIPTPTSIGHVTAAPMLSETSKTVKSTVAIVKSEPEVRTQVNVVTGVKISEQLPSSSSTKGFTLKFPRLASSTSASDEFQTGVVSHNVESKIINGVTTVHETKVLGTFIGTQYARILESSSTILPMSTIVATTTSTVEPTIKILQKAGQVLSSVVAMPEVSTVLSVSSSSGDSENDPRFNEELLEQEEGPVDLNEAERSLTPEPTQTLSLASSEDSTHYVLPEKDQPRAQIYASPIPSPNAYSRQPQIYVDVSPATAYDYVVTATPSRKPFRPQSTRSSESPSRFTTRFANKNPPTSTESNELVLSYDSTLDESSRRNSNRFRSNRNRAGTKPSNKQTETENTSSTVTSVFSNSVTPSTAAPPRKFTRGRTSAGSSAGKTSQEFKLGNSRTTFGGQPGRAQQSYITPTSSTSIYRFKLNRPTGRWRFKPSPKPKVNIIKTKEEEDQAKNKEFKDLQAANSNNGAIYPQGYNDQGEPYEIQTGEESRTESNELGQEEDGLAAGQGPPELVPETIRVATVTPTEFSDFENSRVIEIATIRSPYVFQAGNVKNTRYITLTKTFTKEMIQPTQVAPSFGGNPTLENILGTRAPYDRILEGSSNIATLPVIVLGSDTATPPLETVTQTFSTTQLMLKTSILPVLYDGVTTLYTLTQSYLVTRLVAAYKTLPPAELFHFVPTKSLTEFNTALQEAGTEHREQLLGSENENDANYENIVAPPDELISVGSDFDPSSMDEKYMKGVAKNQATTKAVVPLSKPKDPSIPDLSSLSPEQLAFLRYFASTGQAAGQGLLPMQQPLQNYFPSPLLQGGHQGQFPLVASSPVVVNTFTTLVETKTLRIQFGAKPTHTILYSTRIVPTQVTSYVAASVQPTAAIPNFFQPHHPFPLAYVG